MATYIYIVRSWALFLLPPYVGPTAVGVLVCGVVCPLFVVVVWGVVWEGEKGGG